MIQSVIFAPNSPWLAYTATTTALLILMLIGRYLLARIVARVTKHVLESFSKLLVRLVKQTSVFLLLIISAHFAARWWVLPKGFNKTLSQAVSVAFIIQLGLWASIFANQWFAHYAEKKQAKDPSSLTAFGLLSFAARMIIWIVVALIIVENLGFNISTLVAGLGIGGIAVALAVQNILGDLLGSLSIILDKPFVVGDTIVVGDITAMVEHIGVKTTRLRAISGEQVIITNSDLLSSRIRNFKRLYERRALFTVGVTYDTAIEHVEAIPGILREIVEAQTPVRFDRAHLKELGNSALLYEVVYFVLSSDFQTYMGIQQQVNFTLLRRFKELGVEFAFPTQTLVVKGTNITVR